MSPLEEAREIFRVEEERMRYFLEYSEISEAGMENIMTCYKEAHARVLAWVVREAAAKLHDHDPLTEVGMRQAADLSDPDVAP